jgi:diguanylate cyclase (GGDEF)-like protein/PAS domain S-box-containing protein
MMVTDAEGTILRVNRAFTEMTGYRPEEVIGQKPALLKSGQHDREFYSAMWQQLTTTGGWEGEVWDRRKNGEIFPKWQTISAVSGADAKTTHYVAAFSDISEQKKAEDRITNLAFYDPLTALPNRRLLLDRLQQAMLAGERSRHQGALLFIDLDQFKTLNDTLGHDMGDLLLIEVAKRLQMCVRASDTAARLGGDEFVVMLENLSELPLEAIAQAEIVSEKILTMLNLPYQLAGHNHRSTPSIGVTLFNGQQTGLDELLKQADLAMYQSKASGRNAIRFFDPKMQAVVTIRAALEKDFRDSLEKNEFVLYYQAQVDANGCLTGAEALVRWQHPQRGLVQPNDFIPLAEETGLIMPLGQWVLNTACLQMVAWGENPETTHLTMAVNVSARQFRHADFINQILSTLKRTGADPHKLKLELTESLLLEDVEATIVKMNTLKAIGVGFALDDFGTGYSSLAYLKRLPLDQLKIDRSFITDVLTDDNDAVIARTIVALAKSMGLSVIAEGVELEAQRVFLADQGCGAYQGYLYGQPGAVELLRGATRPA